MKFTQQSPFASPTIKHCGGVGETTIEVGPGVFVGIGVFVGLGVGIIVAITVGIGVFVGLGVGVLGGVVSVFFPKTVYMLTPEPPFGPKVTLLPAVKFFEYSENTGGGEAASEFNMLLPVSVQPASQVGFVVYLSSCAI